MAKINGGNGDDLLTGTAGDDVMNGRGGHDTLYGLDGDDVLTGGRGADWLYGGDGNDTLIGAPGAEYMYGGAGADAFVFDLPANGDRLNDHIFDLNFAEGDTIVIDGVTFDSNADLQALDGMNGFIVNQRSDDVVIYHDGKQFLLIIEDYSLV